MKEIIDEEKSPFSETKPKENPKTQKPPKKFMNFEELKGNHNKFIGEKNDFDFKKFVESTDPEIKKTQKEKVS